MCSTLPAPWCAMAARDDVLTGRLRLRTWADADRPAFAALNADPEVMRAPASGARPGRERRADGPAPLGWDRARDRALGRRASRRDGVLLGWAGLNPMPAARRARGSGRSAGGWPRAAWGHGYATEAATEASGSPVELGRRALWSMTVLRTSARSPSCAGSGWSSTAGSSMRGSPEGHRLRQHVAYVLELGPCPEIRRLDPASTPRSVSVRTTGLGCIDVTDLRATDASASSASSRAARRERDLLAGGCGRRASAPRARPPRPPPARPSAGRPARPGRRPPRSPGPRPPVPASRAARASSRACWAAATAFLGLAALALGGLVLGLARLRRRPPASTRRASAVEVARRPPASAPGSLGPPNPP